MSPTRPPSCRSPVRERPAGPCRSLVHDHEPGTRLPGRHPRAWPVDPRVLSWMAGSNPAITRRSFGLRALGRRVDRHGADFARHRHFEDLEVVRGAQLVVVQPARNIDRVAGFEPAHLAVLEFEFDPTL